MFRRALECNPKHTPSKYHMGLMFKESGDYAISLKLFTEVLLTIGDDRLVYEKRGLVH